jgi:hypothetical protein
MKGPKVSRGRMFVAGIATLAAALAAPGVAQAATATVTFDDGQPRSLAAPVTTRVMTPTVEVVEDGNRFDWQVSILGPDGVRVASPSCWSTLSDDTSRPNYRGNGTYTVVVERFPNGTSCTSGTPSIQRFRYAVAAGVSFQPPPAVLPTRQPGSFSTITHELGFNGNPGNPSYDIYVGKDGVVNPDGTLTTGARSLFLDSTTGRVDVSFDDPGTYVFAARTGASGFFTPWSPQVTVRAMAPFDLSSVSFPDSRGPRYRLKGTVREETASGRVRIAWARGRRGGRFRSAGSARIRSDSTFTRAFSLRRRGVYRLRFTYRGNSTVSAGTVTQTIRIRRILL